MTYEKIRAVAVRINVAGLWVLFWGSILFSVWHVYRAMYPEESSPSPYVARIDIFNEINVGLTDSIRHKIDSAYGDPYAKAILFNIDSGGGAGAEAWRLCDYILSKRNVEAQRKEEDRRLTIATIGSMGASAAYHIAICADVVYATPRSQVGSVGSVYFYNENEQKGIKHIASDTGKVADVKSVAGRKLVEEAVREEADDFLESVISLRGDRLKISKKELASGRTWLGKKALELGLIDGFATPETISRDLNAPLLWVGVPEMTNWDKVKDVLSVLK